MKAFQTLLPHVVSPILVAGTKQASQNASHKPIQRKIPNQSKNTESHVYAGSLQ
jgi:hypothetical protein